MPDFIAIAAFIGLGMLIWDCIEVGRNDAANLVNAVFGARVMRRRVAVAIAAVAVVLGATFSSPVMETARKGIFDPHVLTVQMALAISDEHPDDPDLQNDLAWALATAGIMLDDALRLAKRAVELAPDDGNIWDTLGEAHFRRGEYQDAVTAQTRAVELSPDDEYFQKRLEEWKALTE